MCLKGELEILKLILKCQIAFQNVHAKVHTLVSLRVLVS